MSTADCPFCMFGAETCPRHAPTPDDGIEARAKGLEMLLAAARGRGVTAERARVLRVMSACLTGITVDAEGAAMVQKLIAMVRTGEDVPT